jgi:hypothetical protein
VSIQGTARKPQEHRKLKRKARKRQVKVWKTLSKRDTLKVHLSQHEQVMLRMWTPSVGKFG